MLHVCIKSGAIVRHFVASSRRHESATGCFTSIECPIAARDDWPANYGTLDAQFII